VFQFFRTVTGAALVLGVVIRSYLKRHRQTVKSPSLANPSVPLRLAAEQSWAFVTFSPIRYSLFRYFNTSFRYRYSATFPKIVIRYSLFAIAIFVSSVLRTASILGLYLR
jgi:hypothetical protein